MRWATVGVTLLAIGVGLPAAAQAQSAPPLSDTFSQASTPEPNVHYTIDGTGSFTSAGEPYAPGSADRCPVGGSTQMDDTVWFKVIGTGGRIILSTVDSDFDTVNAVYFANQLPSSSTDWLCSDDAVGNDAELYFQSAAGATYYTQWGGCTTNTQCGDSFGFLNYAILTNDQRSHAAPAINRTRTNWGATQEPSGETLDCGPAHYGRTVWFRWRAPADGKVRFSVARFDTVTALYRGSAPSAFMCNDNAEGDILRSEVGGDVRQGEELFLQVGGKGNGAAAFKGNFSLSVSFDENTDRDGDGFARTPGPDCDDANPSIKPGVRDIAHNGVDEDCAGGDNRDADGDGQARRPAGTDCNDSNPRQYVGAREVRGNFVDENCDGSKPAARLSPEPEVSYGSVALARGRLFGRLTVSRVARGYRVVVRCRGSRRCPARRFRKTARTKRPIRTRKFAGTMPPGARIEISVTLPRQNRFGYYKRYAVRAPRGLAIQTCRIAPRSGKRSQCSRG